MIISDNEMEHLLKHERSFCHFPKNGRAGKKSGTNVKDEMIESNLDLVTMLARKYANHRTRQEDLVSVGSIGLIKAVESFDESKNVKFSTYASTCIKNEMLMYLRSNAYVSREVSLDQRMTTMEEESNDLKLDGILGTDADTVWNVVEREENRKILEAMLLHLPPQQQEIVNYRFGLKGYPEKTQKEVAHLLGVSQSYISKVEKKILTSMRSKINTHQST